MDATPVSATSNAPTDAPPGAEHGARCARCGQPFRRRADRDRFCSDLCRNRAWRAEHKANRSPAASLQGVLSDALAMLRRGEQLSADLVGRVRLEMDRVYPPPAPAPAPAVPKARPEGDDLRARFKAAQERVKGLQSRAAVVIGCGQPTLSDFAAGRRGLAPERARALAVFLDGEGF
jgi:endogenous inhibitor of DNA gyrase (YacG/DUF329 family)